MTPALTTIASAGSAAAKGEAVGGDDARLRPGEREIVARPPREARIDFERRHFPAPADDCGEDGAVVARAGADVDHALAALKIELVEEARPKGSAVRC